jgi:alpha-beta hydrolase superfamily lysophospholipase
MKKTSLLVVNILFSFLSLGLSVQALAGPTGFNFFKDNYETQVPLVKSTELRVGVYLESPAAKLKGCVLYLEGLGDSIANHEPLFKTLSEAGYRTLAYDYMGQGGSVGTMNSTRIQSTLAPSLEIGTQARYVWDKYTQVANERGQDCRQSKKFVIGWSTGGLAAYKLAHEEWADAVVLIAPGIHIKTFVGEAADSPSLMLRLKQVISERTLTSNTFVGSENPHVDAIKPGSPALIPLFAQNLLLTSIKSQSWKIAPQVKGLVFLSGASDTYVNSPKTAQTLVKNAAHFSVVSYKEALHEIDNEVPAIEADLRLKTVQFFDQ